MAKNQADGKSLSQHIREYLNKKPAAKSKEIVEALAAKGIEVSLGLASNVKYTSGPGVKRKKRVRGAAGRTVMRARPGGRKLDLASLRAAARFVADVGDAEKAIAAIKQVQSLQVR